MTLARTEKASAEQEKMHHVAPFRQWLFPPLAQT